MQTGTETILNLRSYKQGIVCIPQTVTTNLAFGAPFPRQTPRI